MKIGRYIIVESSIEKELASLLVKRDNNHIEISWRWPGDQSIKLAAVLEIDDIDSFCGLEHYINSFYENVNIVTRQFDSVFKDHLDKKQKRFAVYPALFGDNNEIIIINQKNNNITEPLLRTSTIFYSIEEKKHLIGNNKAVRLYFEPTPYSDDLPWERVIFYTVSGSREKFPIDLDMLNGHKKTEILLPKSAFIQMHVHEKYEDIVSFAELKNRRGYNNVL